MPRVFCLIRPLPHYRSDAFHAGLKACGYEVHTAMKGDIRPDDVLCLWNRYGTNHEYAKQFEAAGATVLVAENGYLGCDTEGKQMYALARSWHNGAGTWHVGDSERWKSQNITLRPWRETGEEILVLPQRGFGPQEVAMPEGWVDATVKTLKQRTSRPVRVRKHPGNHPPEIPIEDDLNVSDHGVNSLKINELIS